MARSKDSDVGVGDVLGGKYRIEREIGRGGMATVVAARHLELGTRVAIKLFPKAHSNDTELITRFMREARASAKLKSEHAVKVVDVGKRKSGLPFMVMELLEGEDLSSVITRGPVPIPVAVGFILQACEAIAEAHAQAIVHRDLKPSNLFLVQSTSGPPLVKVLDFGLAKRVVFEPALTATTAVMGSPQYMSPEQLRATRDVDFRTDLWSLGVCLYELVSGRLPFESDAVAVVNMMVLKEDPPPLTALRPDVPPAFWAVVQKCLAKEPLERFTTVSELVAALEPFASPEGRGATARIEAIVSGAKTTSFDASGVPDGAGELIETRTRATFGFDFQRSGAASWAVVGLIIAAVTLLVGEAGYLYSRGWPLRSTQLHAREFATYTPERVADGSSRRARSESTPPEKSGSSGSVSSPPVAASAHGTTPRPKKPGPSERF